MIDRSMKGLFPILAMPFDAKGQLEIEDLQREVEFAIGAGAHGVGIAMASEVFKLSEAERDLATTTVVEQAGSRVKVVINTGAQGTDLSVHYSRRAEELGADAVMVAPPTMVPTTDLIVREHYRHISEAVRIPIFMQDFETAPVPPALAAQIAGERDNACYLKAETPPTPSRVAQAVKAGGGNLIVFGGAGGNSVVEEARRGSSGTMPHCALPDMFRKVWDRIEARDRAGAETELNRFAPLLKLIGQAGGGSSFHVVKEILRLRGVFKAAYVRSPAIPPDGQTYREVRRAVESLGLAEVTT